MIHCLPGMGADHRMFPKPWTELPELVLHDWPAHLGEKTLEAKARSLVELFHIDDGDVLVGASLGGMVALEIAKIRRLRLVVLVGSARHPDETSRFVGRLYRMAPYFPLFLLKAASYPMPFLLLKMFRHMEPAFFRDMCPAIYAWKGANDVPVTVFRIHGKDDLLIPGAAKADLWLEGGHLISITQAAACVQQVRRLLDLSPAEERKGSQGK